MHRIVCLGSALLVAACASEEAASRPSVQISTAHGSPAERETQRALEGLLARYDLEPWRFTSRVVVDEEAIPHSHPALTLHSRHNGDDPMLLATYVHEQLHWYAIAHSGERDRAVAAFREAYPDPPVGYPEGASDAESTWLHLLVCWLELEAMTELVGRDEARAIMARQDHYTWIYERVLTDETVGQINRAAGFEG